MKNILFLLYIFFTVNLNAQSFLPFENSSYKDFTPEIQELENGNFVYLQTYYFPEDEMELAELLTATDSVYSVLKLVDERFQPLAEFPIKTTNSEETLMAWDIFPMDHGFLITGIAFSPFTNFRKIFIIEIDENFNEVRRNIVAHSSNIYWEYNPIINFDGNLVFIGGYNGIPSSSVFLAEYSIDGDLLNIASFPTVFADDFVQLPDSSYRVYIRLANRIRDLPADWSEFSEVINLNPDNSFISSNSNFLLGDGRWLFSGVGLEREPTTSERYYFSQLMSVQSNMTIKSIYKNIPPDSTFAARGYRTMDMIDTSCIYFSTLYEVCDVFSHPIDSCHNFISIHNVHLNGTENWTKYLGFDASYYPVKVLATKDEGVLLLVYRYNEVDNLEDEGDMYFIKLDKEGNIDFMTGTKEEIPTIRIQQFLVYPNPARDVLRFTYGNAQIIAPFIQLFDSAGRLVLEDQILDKETDISSIVPGNYFYQILDQQKQLQTGSIIKQ